MGRYGLRLYYKTLFWLGVAYVSAYTSYRYWKRSKPRWINKDDQESHRVKILGKKMLLLGLKGSGKSSLVNQIFSTNETDMKCITLLDPFKRSLTVLENTSYRIDIYEISCDCSVETWQYVCMDSNLDLIIFVIDSSDVSELPVATTLLKDVICDPRIRETPILIIASKQDHSNALKPEQIKEALNLPNLIVSLHKIEVIGCQTNPLPDLPKGPSASQYHNSVSAVRKEIFSMAGL